MAHYCCKKKSAIVPLSLPFKASPSAKFLLVISSNFKGMKTNLQNKYFAIDSS